MKLKIKKLNPNAKIPTKAHDTDAGIDLYSVEDISIRPGETVKVHTGIVVQLEDTYELFKTDLFKHSKFTLVNLLWDRSSLGSKGIHRLAGVLDYSYTGEALVCLTNLNTFPLLEATPKIFEYKMSTEQYRDLLQELTYNIKAGDKICQMLVQTVVPVTIEEGEIHDTERGNKGFGSSG